VKLSPHFTLSEFTRSQWALRSGIKNDPDEKVLANLKRLAGTLELVRYALGVPVHVSSGYRSDLVNRAVGGASSSKHLIGLAADFTAPTFGAPYEIGQRILDVPHIQFDQLIHEFGGWVHIGLAPEGVPVRREVLSIFRPGRYLPGWVEKESP